jgi:hypothetical protein
VGNTTTVKRGKDAPAATVTGSQSMGSDRKTNIYTLGEIRYAFQEIEGWSQYLYGFRGLVVSRADIRCVYIEQGTYPDFLKIIDYLNDKTIRAGRFVYETLTPEPNMEKTKEKARELWRKLGDICIFEKGDEDRGDFEPESICTPFLHFPVGTPREDIWHWFEATFPITVHELMGMK